MVQLLCIKVLFFNIKRTFRRVSTNVKLKACIVLKFHSYTEYLLHTLSVTVNYNISTIISIIHTQRIWYHNKFIADWLDSSNANWVICSTISLLIVPDSKCLSLWYKITYWYFHLKNITLTLSAIKANLKVTTIF